MATPETIADRLLNAYDNASFVEPITSTDPTFDLAAAYDVLHVLTSRRQAQGWTPIGRKIGFTNRTLWERYGVAEPLWAHVWDRTVTRAEDGRAELSLRRFVQPRIELEVVFKTSAPIGPTDDPMHVLTRVEWVAAGFEIVQSNFPDWRFALSDCTAAFGLHGHLVVGAPLPVTDGNREALATTLPATEVTLSRDGEVVDRGVGSNVLDGPAHALAYLTRVLAGQPSFAPIAAGEIITTGTITDAWPVEPGQTWTSDYGSLGLRGLTLTFAE